VISHPIFARTYQRLSVTMDRAGASEHRRALVTGLRGRVIEVGAGNGRMFAHYPREIEEVLAVEPEPRLRAAAITAARTARVPVRVVDGTADALPAADGEFDAAVTSLVLCTVPDQATALTEIRRTLRPGGELRFYEHGPDPSRTRSQLTLRVRHAPECRRDGSSRRHPGRRAGVPPRTAPGQIRNGGWRRKAESGSVGQ